MCMSNYALERMDATYGQEAYFKAPPNLRALDRKFTQNEITIQTKLNLIKSHPNYEKCLHHGSLRF
jgi:hypothetical protein